jgi:hypothetical protein
MIGYENDPAQRLGFRRRFGKEHNRALRFSHEPTCDIAEKRMQHHLLFQRASNNYVDVLTSEST